MTTTTASRPQATSTSLPRSSAEAQGISSQAISEFLSAVNEQVRHFHSFMLVRHGNVVAEGWWHPYQWSQRHTLFSLTKSFTSTAVGLAISEGKLSLDDAVVSFFPEQCPAEIGPTLQKLKVRHLLTMGTGQTKEPNVRGAADGDWVRAFLACSPDSDPGSVFAYNSAASHMLSAIVQKVTGEKMADYLKPRLLEPLRIDSFHWERDPMGRTTGGWGLHITTEDIAKFGQLYLKLGQWNGRQLIPANWVGLATSKQIENGTNPESDWNQGYGFQFWRCRHNAYRGDGAFGQYCVVMPEQDAVIAITSGVGNMQLVLDLAWKHLLPAMKPSAVPANSHAASQLQAQLASLSLPTVAGSVTSSVAQQVSGQTYSFPANDHIKSIQLQFSSGQCHMIAEMNHGRSELSADFAKWFSQFSDGEPVAASYAWTDDTTCQVLAWQTATPFSRLLTCQFAGPEITLTMDQNVSFGPTRTGPITGQMLQRR